MPNVVLEPEPELVPGPAIVGSSSAVSDPWQSCVVASVDSERAGYSAEVGSGVGAVLESVAVEVDLAGVVAGV